MGLKNITDLLNFIKNYCQEFNLKYNNKEFSKSF